MLKPIRLLYDKNINPSSIDAVKDGVSEILDIAGVKVDISEDHSIDELVSMGMRTSRDGKQINGHPIHADLAIDSEHHNRYNILVLDQDLNNYSSIPSIQKDYDFILGFGDPGFGVILSTFKFQTLDEQTRYECIKTEAIHETGHMFGLPDKNRGSNLQEKGGIHCTNICVMRQGFSVPKDWINMTKDRFDYGNALCDQCSEELIYNLNK